ncbi:MAG: DUF4352 domain-containing protein [Thermoanaerobacterales bacterium]|jgi:hypothetical protein|nr:DUF4352 domain-containing protein [Thermoanaerobacterales bacterium]MDR9756336.1 DUF4352 domain-containing protein [Thermoanaerobacterales bacterium]
MQHQKISLLLALCFLFTIVLCGCGETTEPKKATTEPTETKQQQTFKIGERVEMGELVITVNSVNDSQGSEFLKPAAGHVYKIVDCTIENLSDEAEVISSLMMFKMADSKGYNYNVTIADSSKPSLDGELGPGRKMRGEIAFEVPTDATGLELIFEPDFLGFGQAIFKLD